MSRANSKLGGHLTHSDSGDDLTTCDPDDKRGLNAQSSQILISIVQEDVYPHKLQSSTSNLG